MRFSDGYGTTAADRLLHGQGHAEDLDEPRPPSGPGIHFHSGRRLHFGYVRLERRGAGRPALPEGRPAGNLYGPVGSRRILSARIEDE